MVTVEEVDVKAEEQHDGPQLAEEASGDHEADAEDKKVEQLLQIAQRLTQQMKHQQLKKGMRLAAEVVGVVGRACLPDAI